MYESSYGLTDRPFLSGPSPSRYYPAFAIESARRALSRCLERGEGAGLLIGPSGTGKTLLCRLLADQLKQNFQVAIPDCGRIASSKMLLQSVLFELGRPYRGMEEGELRLSLIDHVSCDGGCPGGVLLVVDEAQTLPGRIIDELRLLTNLVRQGEPRVRLLLSGAPGLEERLAHPRLEQFSQRIAARCYLEALSRDETRNYVCAQITNCGGDPTDIFTEDAFEAVFRATDGIPRLINQVCDHALVLGFAGEQTTISGAGIEEAWADLQQLPTPLSVQAGPTSERAASGDEAVIEFGSLDEASSSPEPFEAQEAPLAQSADGTFCMDSHEPVGEAADEPLEHLSDLERRVDELDAEFQPAGSIQPEIELSIPDEPGIRDDNASNAFDDEEVVIDRYRDLDAMALARCQSVQCAEGHELSQLLESLEPAAEPPIRLASTEEHNQPAETPVDDNDLIVIEDSSDALHDAPEPASARAKRKEYRQLFSQLRSG